MLVQGPHFEDHYSSLENFFSALLHTVLTCGTLKTTAARVPPSGALV